MAFICRIDGFLASGTPPTPPRDGASGLWCMAGVVRQPPPAFRARAAAQLCEESQTPQRPALGQVAYASRGHQASAFPYLTMSSQAKQVRKHNMKQRETNSIGRLTQLMAQRSGLGGLRLRLLTSAAVSSRGEGTYLERLTLLRLWLVLATLHRGWTPDPWESAVEEFVQELTDRGMHGAMGGAGSSHFAKGHAATPNAAAQGPPGDPVPTDAANTGGAHGQKDSGTGSPHDGLPLYAAPGDLPGDLRLSAQCHPAQPADPARRLSTMEHHPGAGAGAVATSPVHGAALRCQPRSPGRKPQLGRSAAKRAVAVGGLSKALRTAGAGSGGLPEAPAHSPQGRAPRHRAADPPPGAHVRKTVLKKTATAKLKPFYIDLLAGSQGITKAFRRRGLRCDPFDLNQGVNGVLLNRGVYRRILKLIRPGSCRGIFAAPPCTTYNSDRHTRSSQSAPLPRFARNRRICCPASAHRQPADGQDVCALVGRRCASHPLSRGEPAE